jgi:flavin reductase (DIM6/NTAB) family NADH-FMN oxidoreductase RutF
MSRDRAHWPHLADDIARKVVEIGGCSGSDTDKFKRFELTPLKAKSVEAPLIKECLANIECRVTDYIEKHNIFIPDVSHAWIDSDRMDRRTMPSCILFF